MSRTSNEDQFKFLISCIRHSMSGKIDFTEVANECNIVSKGAAAKRYERMMKTHGINPNGNPRTAAPKSPSSDSSTPQKNSKKENQTPSQSIKKRKLEDLAPDQKLEIKDDWDSGIEGGADQYIKHEAAASDDNRLHQGYTTGGFVKTEDMTYSNFNLLPHETGSYLPTRASIGSAVSYGGMGNPGGNGDQGEAAQMMDLLAESHGANGENGHFGGDYVDGGGSVTEVGSAMATPTAAPSQSSGASQHNSIILD